MCINKLTNKHCRLIFEMSISWFLKEKFPSQMPCWITNCVSNSKSEINIIVLCFEDSIGDSMCHAEFQVIDWVIHLLNVSYDSGPM